MLLLCFYLKTIGEAFSGHHYQDFENTLEEMNRPASYMVGKIVLDL